MLKFICLFLSLILSINAQAKPCNQDDSSCALTEFKDNKIPEEVIVHKIEKDIVSLPSCEDEKLLEAVSNYIKEYYKNNKKSNVYSRRRQYFIENNINSFSKENIIYYKSQDKRPMSDIIVNLKVNSGIIEENMLLCKNNSKNQEASKLYILIHPYEGNYKVHVINLTPEYDVNIENSFIYEG